MNRRIVGLLFVALAVVGVACVDMGAPKGPASISTLQLPSPSIVVGDSMRDSNGVVAPLIVVAYDANGTPVIDASTQFFIVDSAHLAHVTTNHLAVGDKLGLFRIFGEVGSLQTPIVTIPVTAAPDHFARTGTADTLVAPLSADTTVFGVDTLSVTLKSVADSGSQGFVVKYSLTRAPASASSTAPAVFLADDGGKIASADTSDALGLASRRLIVKARLLGDSVLKAGQKVDSAVIVVSTSYKGRPVRGSPITFVIPIKVKLAF